MLFDKICKDEGITVVYIYDDINGYTVCNGSRGPDIECKVLMHDRNNPGSAYKRGRIIIINLFSPFLQSGDRQHDEINVELVRWHELGHIMHTRHGEKIHRNPSEQLIEELAAHEWALRNYRGALLTPDIMRYAYRDQIIDRCEHYDYYIETDKEWVLEMLSILKLSELMMIVDPRTGDMRRADSQKSPKFSHREISLTTHASIINGDIA